MPEISGCDIMPGCGIEDRNVLKGILILILCLVFSCPFGLYAEICMSGDFSSSRSAQVSMWILWALNFAPAMVSFLKTRAF